MDETKITPSITTSGFFILDVFTNIVDEAKTLEEAYRVVDARQHKHHLPFTIAEATIQVVLG